jgi:hypothetical protein
MKLMDLIQEIVDEYTTHRVDRFKNKGHLKDKLAQRRVHQGVELKGSTDNHSKASVFIIPDPRVVQHKTLKQLKEQGQNVWQLELTIAGATIKVDGFDDIINEDTFHLNYKVLLEKEESKFVDYNMEVIGAIDNLTPANRKAANRIAKLIETSAKDMYKVGTGTAHVVSVEVHPNSLISKDYR